VTHFVAGLGTTGTFMGVGRRLKEANPAIHLTALQPADELQVIEGLKHLETSLMPGIYNPALADRHLAIDAVDALDMTRRLAREAGLLVGFSAGAAVHGALQVANTLKSGVVVTLLPDGGAKYLSLGLFD
jgi:cysteine synthase B